ncbi:hypothetical protein PIB19_00770 [Sphingomonas sp. 7/4-4]|uniref:hypothetical protein n=1 Tax=Sphingomonas sp. 7/4-4 TaxID=3018446 RepID=UPI0022F3E672|nr:hypothetical protein [Sphingomonas sp. 7/4-4]WBY08123.1 hypothetical protein PIB19_00770 [Sphingomonas sp. 7/4-4]
MRPEALAEPSSRGMGHRTAQRAVEILLEVDPAYRCPTRAERDAMLVGFARHRKVLYGAAFDVIRVEGDLDLSNSDAVAEAIERITICEVKSTNRAAMGSDLKGYFFNITAAELLTAQSVGERYRFVFVNTLTGEHQEMRLAEIFGRARAMYPAWHIRF